MRKKYHTALNYRRVLSIKYPPTHSNIVVGQIVRRSTPNPFNKKDGYSEERCLCTAQAGIMFWKVSFRHVEGEWSDPSKHLICRTQTAWSSSWCNLQNYWCYETISDSARILRHWLTCYMSPMNSIINAVRYTLGRYDSIVSGRFWLSPNIRKSLMEFGSVRLFWRKTFHRLST